MSVYSKIDLKGADGEAYDGSVTNRFERDYEHMGVKDTAGKNDNRKGRQLDEQTIERQGRLYVDRETLISATGKDAELETNGYGGTTVGVENDVKPANPVKSYQDAVDKSLVPAKGDHVAPPKTYDPPTTPEEDEEEEEETPGTDPEVEP